jgi:hypothetical protein
MPEQMIEKHYQFCLIDTKGDYVDLRGVVRIGDKCAPARAGRNNFIIAEPYTKHYRLYTGRSARRPAAVLQHFAIGAFENAKRTRSPALDHCR